MTAHRAAWVCHWQSIGQAKSYSVDVGVQQGILCKSTELSTLFSGKTAILRQSRVGTLAFRLKPLRSKCFRSAIRRECHGANTPLPIPQKGTSRNFILPRLQH